MSLAVLCTLLAPAFSAADALDEFVEHQRRTHGIPGLSLAVTRGDRLVELRAYGHANLELGVPCRPGTVFRLGSTTKMFTALAAAKLVEAGRWDYGDRLSSVLPGLPHEWREVTLHHALTHTSGLPDVLPEDLDAETFEELLTGARERPMTSAPGARWSYNQLGYVLVGRAIERSTGSPWATYARETFAAPLELGSARFGGDETIVPGRATYYAPAGADGVRSAQGIEHPPPLWNATGWNMSAADLARFDLALRSGQLVARAELERLWEPARREDGTIFGFRGGTLLYGRGWATLFDPERGEVRAVGNEGGTSTAYWHYPAHEATVLVMTNLDADEPLATRIADGVAELLFAEPLPAEPQKDVPAGGPERPAWTGEVRSAVQRTRAAVPFPGVAVGIVRGPELVLSAGFGLADLERRTPVTEDTLFQIGSATKPFTTTLLGRLVAEGSVELDAPVTAYLPEGLQLAEGLGADRITLRHLAAHLSGMPAAPLIAGREIDSELVLSFTHYELYQSLAVAAPVAAPGDAFHYSMLGYGLLGHVLELASERPFELLLREKLLEPLGMANTTVTLGLEHRARLATPYHLAPGAMDVEPSLTMDLEALAPAGGIASCVEDLAAFVSLHLGAFGEEVLPEELRHQLHVQHWTFSPSLGYALGWGLDRMPGIDPIVFHDGRCAGYTSYVGLSPRHGVGVIVLANAGGDDTPRPVRELGRELLRIAVETGR